MAKNIKNDITKDKESVKQYTTEILFALLLFSIVIALLPAPSVITSEIMYGNVSITLSSANAPYIYPINIVVHAGDHVSLVVDAGDVDGNVIFFNDTCSFFDVGSDGEINFIVSNSPGIYTCSISATDLWYTNTSAFRMEILSYCGDGYCNDENENCYSCPLDCGICKSPKIPEIVQKNQLCTPQWNCSDWGRCQKNGFQERACRITNDCDNPLIRPYESKKCAYKSNSLENTLDRMQSLISKDRVAAVKELNSILDVKKKDVSLLKELKFDQWQDLGLTSKDLETLDAYLEKAKSDIKNADKIDVASAENILKTVSAQVSDIISNFPEVVLIGKTCKKNTLEDINQDVQIEKCYTNYEITNTETSDENIKRAKVVLQVTAKKNLPMFNVVEEVDKKFAQNIKDIIFYNPEAITIINPDPVFEWTIKDVKANDVLKLEYIVKNNVNDSATLAVQPEITEKPTTFLGQAIFATGTNCSVLSSYRIISLFLLFIFVACLIVSNLLIPINSVKLKDKRYIILAYLNSLSYYCIFILSICILVRDLLCFDYSLLKEILAVFILVFTTYYLNQPLRWVLSKHKKRNK